MNRDSKGAPQLPPPAKPNSLADSAKKNPSQLGDPVSLKAEPANSSPTEHDKGASGDQKNATGQSGGKDKDKETLAEKALKNPTALGDPISIKAESSTRVPTDEAEGAKKSSKL